MATSSLSSPHPQWNYYHLYCWTLACSNKGRGEGGWRRKRGVEEGKCLSLETEKENKTAETDEEWTSISTPVKYNDLLSATQQTDKWPLSLSVVGIVYPVTRTVLFALPRPCFSLITVGSHTPCDSQGSALIQRSIHHTHTMPWCGRLGRTDPRLQACMHYGKYKYNMWCVCMRWQVWWICQWMEKRLLNMPLGVNFRGVGWITVFKWKQVRSRKKTWSLFRATFLKTKKTYFLR